MSDLVFKSADGRAVVLGGGFLATKLASGVWARGFPGTADDMNNEFSSVSDESEALTLSREARTSLSETPDLAKN